LYQPYLTSLSLRPLPLSLCIVTNKLDAKLERIIDLCSQICQEILISYDNNGAEDYRGFTENKQTTIIPVTWEGYSTTKNKLAAKAKYDWILSLDADEIPDEKLLLEIGQLPINSLSVQQQFYFKRVSILGNYKILFGSWGSDTVVRLYNKTFTSWNNEKVHEKLMEPKGAVLSRLKGVLYHYTVADFDEYLAKNRKYAQLSAEKYYAQGKKSSVVKKYLKTAFTFFKEYILQLGFLDGIIGFRLALGNARYTYWKYQLLLEKHQSAENSATKVST